MRTLKTSEAAELLNVSPNTLRAWERRFGYPRPQRSPGRHRLYTYAEIEALRTALHGGLSVSSAVSVAQESVPTDVSALVGALLGFRRTRADGVMEASLALRPIERAVEDLLLTSLEELLRRKGRKSAAWAFACPWATDWLRRAQRLVGPPDRHLSVLVGSAAQRDTDPAGPYIAALELFFERAGAEVLSLSVRAIGGLPEAVAALRPDGLIVAGGHAESDAVARWIYSVRTSIGPRPVALFHRSRDASASRLAVPCLDHAPSRAQEEFFGVVESQAAFRRSRRRGERGAEAVDVRRNDSSLGEAAMRRYGPPANLAEY